MSHRLGLPARRNPLEAFTTKQLRFIEEYLVDHNATQATIRAGYSRKTARQTGQENLTKPDIALAINDALSRRRLDCEATADALRRELTHVAFSDIGAVFKRDAQGRVRLKPVTEIPVETASAIKTLRTYHST